MKGKKEGMRVYEKEEESDIKGGAGIGGEGKSEIKEVEKEYEHEYE